MQKVTILAVDDDAELQAALRHYLEQEGCTFLSALNAKDLAEHLENARPDIILLDLMLPQEDGLTLLTMIRRKSNAAIIVISGKKESVDRVIALEMGADDYLTKPFDLRELLAKSHAVIRRTTQQSVLQKVETPLYHANKISFNGWILDRQQYQLLNPEGTPADLTSGEFKLLEAFVTAPNRVLSREHLFALTRPGDFDSFDRAIDIQIGRIRKKINDDPRNPALLKTIRGVGYLFAADPHIID